MNRSSGPNAPPGWRRLFHLIAAGGTTLLALAIPERPYLFLLGSGALLAVAMEAWRFRTGPLNAWFLLLFAPILKATEKKEITGATYFLLAAFFSFFFYGADVAIPVLLFVSVGDPMAGLVGARAPGPRLWGKSPVGSAAFFVAALAAWAIMSAVGLADWTWAIVTTAAFAAAVEITPIPVDDNLTIPLLAGAFLTLLTAAGW